MSEKELGGGVAATAHSRATEAQIIVGELCEQFAARGEDDPAAIVFFCGHTLDGAAIAAGLRGRLPNTEVVGCTSAGEYTDGHYGRGGTAAMALSRAKVGRCAAALAQLGEGVDAGVRAACASLSARLGDVRELDADRHVGLALIDGAHEREEEVNEALGNVAPFLSFVGGSAGDDIAFERTQVFCNGERSDDGAALLVLEMAPGVPFRVVKTSHFAPTDTAVEVTKVGGTGRLVLELDGRPAREVYAELIGVEPDALTNGDCFPHPLGLMIGGKAWLRSVLALPPDQPGALLFACRMLEGATLQLMRPLDLVEDTVAALDEAAEAMGAPIAGAIQFDCAYRRLEIEARDIAVDYHQAIARQSLVGLHTHGESWLGHMNQTLTCLVFG